MEEKQKYTQEGYDKLQAELDRRSKEDRERIKTAIAEAKSFGDLSENAEYDEARNEQAANEARIKELEELIQHAVIIDGSQVDADIVSLGSSVKVLRNGKEVVYRLVGSNEADPFENKISDLSPIGKALIGARAGDEVTVDAPSGSIQMTVLEVDKA